MADIVSPETRSRMMSTIRGRDTKPEMLVRRHLHGLGFRYRLSPRDLPGRPDLVLPRHKVAIFVHGCFWHGHDGCRFATVPATRTEFWTAKIAANKARDAAAEEKLRALGWRLAIVWECALRLDQSRTLQRVADFIVSGEPTIEMAV
ncbi:very short patch repair endonuclease [Lysobacter cavernae]|uniref:Very short patch repair endonuclease n=1 Tax=Lysobacter cavernae TaxID=1685901 RepID=A0ABV7RL51_9GAMM